MHALCSANVRNRIPTIELSFKRTALRFSGKWRSFVLWFARMRTFPLRLAYFLRYSLFCVFFALILIGGSMSCFVLLFTLIIAAHVVLSSRVFLIIYYSDAARWVQTLHDGERWIKKYRHLLKSTWNFLRVVFNKARCATQARQHSAYRTFGNFELKAKVLKLGYFFSRCYFPK